MIEHFFSGGLMAPTTLILERGAVMIRKALLLILLVSLFLSACNTTTSESITDAISNSGVEASNDSVTHIQALSDHYWIAASPDVITRGSANSAGFYQIIMQSNGRSNLLFTDHAAEKQVYLCSTPSCEHSDASCSSFIDSAGYYVFPVALEDKLLVVYSYISLPDEAPKPSKVEMMDLNGTNRRTLCELENGITLRDGAAASEKSLTLCGNRVQENGPGQVQVQPCLFEIDIETGACSELYRTAAAEGEQQKSLFLRGVSGTGFILKTITTEEYETSEDMQADIERMENATVHRVFELPFDGGPEHELLCYRGNAYYEEYSGEALYYLDYREDESSCDLCRVGPGGAKEILVEDFAAQPAVRKTTVPFTSGNVFIYGFLNEYVLVNHLYSEQYDDAGNMELLYTQYAVNQNTGEITEITLSNYSMATQKAINIIAQFGDDLLVDAKEGSENDLAYRRTGFIRVEDYLASNPNYRMVAQAYVESAQLA